jgi:hypothetical protein
VRPLNYRARLVCERLTLLPSSDGGSRTAIANCKWGCNSVNAENYRVEEILSLENH